MKITPINYGYVDHKKNQLNNNPQSQPAFRRYIVDERSFKELGQSFLSQKFSEEFIKNFFEKMKSLGSKIKKIKHLENEDVIILFGNFRKKFCIHFFDVEIKLKNYDGITETGRVNTGAFRPFCNNAKEATIARRTFKAIKKAGKRMEENPDYLGFKKKESVSKINTFATEAADSINS